MSVRRNDMVLARSRKWGSSVILKKSRILRLNLGNTTPFNRGFRYFNFGFVALAVSILTKQTPLTYGLTNGSEVLPQGADVLLRLLLLLRMLYARVFWRREAADLEI